MSHYTREDLDMFRHGKLSVLGRIACAAHLKQCPECAAKLRELEDDDAFLRRLRDSVRMFDEAAGTQPAPSARTDP